MTDEEQEEERRRRKLARRQAKKMAKHLAELGLDENGNRIDNLTLLNYPVRECKFSLPGFHEAIAVNPLVSLLGGIILWLFVVWSVGMWRVSHCMVQTNE